MKTFEDVYAVLNFLWTKDIGLDGVLINTNDGIDICAICSDFFHWGSADAESIEASEVPELEKAHSECCALEEYSDWGLRLFVARKRKMRPMDCCYDNIPDALHPLFDAAGPYRPMTPDNHPRKRK